MTQTKNNIDSRKEKHLSYVERCQIEVLKKEDYSNRQIAGVLERAPQTIHNKIKRGTITQLKREKKNGKVYDYYDSIYSADEGQAHYDKERLNSGRLPKWADTDAFTNWADNKKLHEKWSPDVVVGFALKQDLFNSTIIPCTTTLYQWIDRGIMKTTNLDLLEKLSRKIKKRDHRHRLNKRILGKSIDERPEAVGTRETFDHWEIDTVVGNKV